jgi:hypothetical protein
MLKELIRLANDLDSKGLTKEADYLDTIIKSAMDEESSSEEHVPLRIQMGKPKERETYEMAPEDLIRIIEEDDRPVFSEDTLPVVEEYDAEYEPSNIIENKEYRINHLNKSKRDGNITNIDFFPGFEGPEEEFMSKYREDPDFMEKFVPKITGREIKRNRRKRLK